MASDGFDMAGALRSLKMPVLFVNGPHDPLIAQDAEAWAERVRDKTSAEALVLQSGESCEL